MEWLITLLWNPHTGWPSTPENTFRQRDLYVEKDATGQETNSLEPWLTQLECDGLPALKKLTATTSLTLEEKTQAATYLAAQTFRSPERLGTLLRIDEKPSRNFTNALETMMDYTRRLTVALRNREWTVFDSATAGNTVEPFIIADQGMTVSFIGDGRDVTKSWQEFAEDRNTLFLFPITAATLLVVSNEHGFEHTRRQPLDGEGVRRFNQLITENAANQIACKSETVARRHGEAETNRRQR